MQGAAAIVAVVFGVITVFAGGRVLAGADPGYVVSRPLVLFNTAMGVVYVLAGVRAWLDHRGGRAWARAIALLNLLVLVTIAVAYAVGGGIAAQSLMAMSFRTLVWGGLFLALSRVDRRAASPGTEQADTASSDDGWVIRGVEDAPATISSVYAVDHDDIDRLLEQFRAGKADTPAAVLAMYREFKTRLVRHIRWEDDLLFPMFERLTGLADNGPTVVMRSEHREIRALLDAIDVALQRGDTSVDADEAALLEVLAEHNRKEESILYPMIDRQVSAAEREAVFAVMHAETGGGEPGTNDPAARG